MVRSVLVVDDDAAFLAIAKQVLEEMGLEVVTAEDAAAAVREADAKRPEAALVDVGLPDRNGIDLARQLAGSPWRPRVLVTSTDPEAARAIEDRQGSVKLPFIRKEDLMDGRLCKLLMGR